MPESHQRTDRHQRLERSRFFGLDVSDHPMEIVAAHVADAIEDGMPLTIVPLNPHVFLTALEQPTVASILKRSLVPLDGVGVILVSRVKKVPLHHRFTGTDLMESIVMRLAERRKSVFLLGGRHGVAAASSEVLVRRHAGLRIAGVFEPDFVDDATRLPEADIVEMINRSGADALFVALGAPKQEVFLERNRDRLRVPFAMSVGASFDFISGRKRRAPLWMRERGMEWIFRVIQEPIRLGPRYAFGIPRFFWSTLVQGRSIQ
jgi:N-acetylglucosaminyldiphosphoundecaprenol N-acetyl-beta-D-mannosaminyltransferase